MYAIAAVTTKCNQYHYREKLTFRKKIIQKFNLRSNWSLFWSSESSKIIIWVSWTVHLLVIRFIRKLKFGCCVSVSYSVRFIR